MRVLNCLGPPPHHQHPGPLPSAIDNRMNTNARSAGPPSYFPLASQSPVGCNSEKVRFPDAPHAPASRRPRCRCRSRWPRASVLQLRSSSALWPGLSSRAGAPRASSDAPITFSPEDQRRMASVFSASGLNDVPSLAEAGAYPAAGRPWLWARPRRPRRARSQTPPPLRPAGCTSG